MQKLRKQLLQEKLKSAPEGVKKMYLNSFERMTFQTEEDFDGFITEMDKDLADLNQDISNSSLKGASGAPARGTASGGRAMDKVYMEETKAMVDRLTPYWK